MDNVDKEHDDRHVMHFLKEPLSDGGTTNTAHNSKKMAVSYPKIT